MKRKRGKQIVSSIVSSELYLDDDCWEHIFKFMLNDDEDDNRLYLKSLSIVNKQFLSITNRLRLSLTVWNPTCSLLSRLFPRFINLIILDLSCYHGLINDLLVQISRYPLKLTSLNISNQPSIPACGLRAFSRTITTINSLICSNIASLSDADLLLISHCFPFLQQLDLSNSDLSNSYNLRRNRSMVFPKLRRINLSGRKNTYMNDAWLLHFCKSFEFLEELVLLRCPLLTLHGIASAIRERPTLKSLSISCNYDITSHFSNSILSLKGLTCLDLSKSGISDELLSSIATRGLPLKKLVLKYCRGYSYDGIFSLLSKCQYIQHLDLTSSRFLNDFLNDQHVANLCMFLGDLMSINLTFCRKLTELSLLSLVRNCLSLGEIKMIGTGIQGVMNSNSFKDLVVSPQLKSLHLGSNLWRKDESIKMFASIFPNLELLDLASSSYIFGVSICHVLRRCRKIKHLNLDGCFEVKLDRMNFKLPELKVLNLSSISVDDETLYRISKNCSELLQLLLARCVYVTKTGIMYVVKNCTQLREINLTDCPKLCPNIVDEMVCSRPSLRKITFSSQFNLKKKKLFSRHGCLLC